jgi:hypothetical protein
VLLVLLLAVLSYRRVGRDEEDEDAEREPERA